MMSALVHVLVPFILCVALANTSLFSEVEVDLTYEHYAEKVIDYMPAFLAMPFNCLINLGYVYIGLYWLLWQRAVKETEQSRYMREVFALMAIIYAGVQWTRLATLRRAPAVLDQWFTMPIFAWVPVWIDFIEHLPGKWRASRAAAFELCAFISYGLSLVHEKGFEVALGCHIVLALYKGVRVHLTHGDNHTRRYFLLAMLSCAGFVVLKLMDHWLTRFGFFQRLTGHFWSKVCDVLQFHFSFCFLITVTDRAQAKTAAQKK
ncbi:transmembrane protein 187 [Melanotaenia boesemani]|uniref:transmembrane protein 187 n=1 Tax=Melanotaenia boesemani TaxID=1250792 RepID=UPI001C03BFC0|nr:transmembrane protein 187 [Melanotaenia boesemani]